MAQSKLDIYNFSLFQIGHTRTVNSPTENTIERKHCDAVYNQHRRAILESSKWAFAKTFIKLSLTGNVTPDGRLEYHYPIECLKALEIVRSSPRVPKIPFMTGSIRDIETNEERRVIWTNAPDAVLLCIRDVTLPSMFTSNFTQALSYRMGVDLATVLAKNSSKSNDMFKLYQWAMDQAILSGEVEAEDEPERDAEWIEQAYDTEMFSPSYSKLRQGY